jgi:DNA polymerase-3 subunit alpha
MSNELSNTDKLSEFFEELKRLNIKVQRPCINKCYPDFAPLENTLFYALGAIKNVGYEAISQVIIEREKNGKFKSISDFINRINPKNINKLQLEGLVKAGAFDSIFVNRKVLYDNIPNIIQNSKNTYENKVQNQSSLFLDDNQKVYYLMQDKNSPNWANNEILSKEFESVGFYLSNHPLEDYKEMLEQYKTKSFKDFENGNDIESFVAGTIMSIKEKKTTKGTSYAIIKFSDQSKVFELFIFSEILEINRKNLVEGKSFLLTIIKDKENKKNRFRRINVRKIVSLEKITKLNYNDVHIEIDTSDNLKKLHECIKEKGNSRIQISIVEKDKNYLFELKDKRKFDYETLKYLNCEHYIKKINI